MKLENKVAIITGSTRGIGRATAELFAKEGAKVVVVGTKEELGAEVVKEIKADGGEAIFCKTDVTSKESLEHLVKTTLDTYGRIDILVNNAGVSDSTPIGKYTAEHFSKVMDLNVNGMMNGILPVVEIMKEQGGGCILNTSSMVSLCGQPGGVAYPASKYAVNGLTWSLARELGPYNIRVNAVAPGITRTDMVAALPKEMIEPLVNRIPLRRIGEAEDIANAFLFLASDMASYVTGEILSVDGAMRT